MPPAEGFVMELDKKHIEEIDKFIADIRIGKLKGSGHVAEATLTLLEQIVTDSSNASAFELCGVLRAAGRRISSALPLELVALNMVRRVLRAVRDENRANADQSGEGAGESLQRLVLATPARRHTLPHAHASLDLRDHIAELRGELETSSSSVLMQARELVRAGSVLLAAGAGPLLEKFLRAAAPHHLVIVEGPDVHESHAMSRRLSTAGVSVTVITGASVFALMSRVNKVVVPVCALGGGAALGAAGLRSVALAASHYAVPVLALCPLYKLIPLHISDPHDLNALASPLQTADYSRCGSDEVRAISPRFDIVPPEHITLFITNQGGCSPSYIYRLLSELYDPNDYQI